MLPARKSTPTAKRLFEDASCLSPAAQVELASRLLARVEQEGDRDAKAAFRATLLRRRHEMQTGKVKGLTISQVMRKLERQAGKRR